jgi:heme-degrading monooxygenase HmoA
MRRGDVEEMIIRNVTYHSRPGSDPEGWLQGIASEIRGVPGMRHVTFMKSTSDPSLYCAIMRFRTMDDLEAYKDTGPYKSLVESLTESWLDTSKPVSDTVYEVLDV